MLLSSGYMFSDCCSFLHPITFSKIEQQDKAVQATLSVAKLVCIVLHCIKEKQGRNPNFLADVSDDLSERGNQVEKQLFSKSSTSP